ncbi:hypothetical protein U1Q18_011302 [Sarracenia purpurea var. burkii]
MVPLVIRKESASSMAAVFTSKFVISTKASQKPVEELSQLHLSHTTRNADSIAEQCSTPVAEQRIQFDRAELCAEQRNPHTEQRNPYTAQSRPGRRDPYVEPRDQFVGTKPPDQQACSW